MYHKQNNKLNIIIKTDTKKNQGEDRQTQTKLTHQLFLKKKKSI